MPAHRNPAWSAAELKLLREHYVEGGMPAAHSALPARSIYSIRMKAARLKLKSPLRAPARKHMLNGERLAAAIELREQGVPFSKIAAQFGVCETAATNAITTALCAARGHRPAERDRAGKLLPTEIERLRYMLKKGVKHIEIQQRMGISASSVSHYRRAYNAELEARGKALLPPPGNGERYSGVPVDPNDRKRVEELLLTGLGSIKVSDRTGVSKTSVVKIRATLVKRLKARGQVLPGCDINGRRVKLIAQAHSIPESTKERFRSLLLNGMPVARAATICGIGACSGYRLRNELRDQLAARGEQLPPVRRPGKLTEQARAIRSTEQLSREERRRLRRLVSEHGEEEGRREFQRERRAAAMAPKTFEEQLARVASGAASITRTFKPSRAAPELTLGGVASAAL
ncbi:hypothetical protein [Sphingomonas pituitosa]|uniref:hypothetical protein n=1 Tax=Sphingomonas pituitosa TaxID=99597 RepID=UPI000AA11387|nr:hypothetical protein [Sphingomonas pituitosa]